MKNTYPIILTPDETGYVVHVPDFDIYTEGETLVEAIEMSRDAIGLMGMDMNDESNPLPTSSDIRDIKPTSDGDIITLVDIDFDEYRRKNDMRTVRRNVTLPSWLNVEAERSGINVSAVLQKALKQELNISN